VADKSDTDTREDRQMKTWEDTVQALIDDPAQRELVEACYFDPPHLGALQRFHASAEWQAVRALLPAAPGTAVDIGAGNGIVSHALARDGWTTIAVEPDPSGLVGAEAIRRAGREAGLEIDVRGGTGEALPVDSESADVVIARQVLHHAADLPAFCRDIARVLKPGGMLLALRDHVVTGPGQMEAFFDIHPLHRHYGGENAFEIRQYRAAMEAAGLQIVRQMDAFDTVINLAPYTEESMCEALAARSGPLRPVAQVALSIPPVRQAAFAALSRLDRRPGRLVSFHCVKSAR
jgi:SAM-dependent methyltransferase